jgi:hypothetical protein
MKVNAFKEPDMIFSPAKVDVAFWSSLVNIYFYLANPEELVKMKNEDSKIYYEFIEPFSRFISATETELKELGHIEEKEVNEGA